MHVGRVKINVAIAAAKTQNILIEVHRRKRIPHRILHCNLSLIPLSARTKFLLNIFFNK